MCPIQTIKAIIDLTKGVFVSKDDFSFQNSTPSLTPPSASPAPSHTRKTTQAPPPPPPSNPPGHKRMQHPNAKPPPPPAPMTGQHDQPPPKPPHSRPAMRAKSFNHQAENRGYQQVSCWFNKIKIKIYYVLNYFRALQETTLQLQMVIVRRLQFGQFHKRIIFILVSVLNKHAFIWFSELRNNFLFLRWRITPTSEWPCSPTPTWWATTEDYETTFCSPSTPSYVTPSTSST